MPRIPDPNSPARDATLGDGDCIAAVPEGIIERCAARYDYKEPEPTPVDPEELV